MTENPTYLGDGVYATIDEFGAVVLDLRGQSGPHLGTPLIKIVLESEVWESLVKFMDRAKNDPPLAAFEEERDAQIPTTTTQPAAKGGGM